MMPGLDYARSVSDLPEYVQRNRAYRDEQADQYAGSGRRAWRDDEISWGIWARRWPSDLEGAQALAYTPISWPAAPAAAASAAHRRRASTAG
jgi:hypothetical protein